jgi:hypothetical protein
MDMLSVEPSLAPDQSTPWRLYHSYWSMMSQLLIVLMMMMMMEHQ